LIGQQKQEGTTVPAIECPYCDFRLELKGVKPGLFHPRCPKCNEKFQLKIDNVNAPIVTALKPVEKLDPKIETALGLDFISPAVQRIQKTSVAIAQRPPAQSRVEKTSVAPPAAKLPPKVYDDTPAPPMDEDLRGSIGGYDILNRLGQGGMGSVYLAKQNSLDRNVALKVLSPTLSSDPQFVARFTREAYAAAQLTHHNVVQIHDIGEARDLHFFSMEFVEGQTLADLVRSEGRLDPEAAVGYILQAARGLKFAHDHGMIHRDIKPENLLLNRQGIVKVADLGLVKRAGTSETRITNVPKPDRAAQTQTQLSVAMGTPAYMPPEQATDAARVDQRADIYSLGCTMYVLLTGRPPYDGRTAMEVITKHQKEPIVPPEVIVSRIPRTLSAILLKMVAKKPEDRYQAMGEVIKELEDYLGVESSGPFSPKEEHVKVLEFAVERFNESPWANVRRWCIRGFFVGCVIAILAFAYFGRPLLAGGTVGFGILTFTIYQIFTGITQKTYLFRKTRELTFGASFRDILSFLALCAIGVALLIVFNLHWAWLGFGLLAAGVAIGFHLAVDRLMHKERAVPVGQVEMMLRSMRLRGLEENALRQFISKYSGQYWEEFYEALFGYEAKITARTNFGRSDRGLPRRKFGGWRDPIIHWIDNKMIFRRELRERKLLAKIEARALASTGINQAMANREGKRAAETLIDRASLVRRTALSRNSMTIAPKQKDEKKEIKQINPSWIHDSSVKIESEQEALEGYDRQSWFKRRYGTPLDFVLGGGVRFVLAILLLAGFGLWFKQNQGDRAVQESADIISRQRVVDINARDLKGTIVKGATGMQQAGEHLVNSTGTAPLRIKGIPDKLCDVAGSWNAGIAGALLLLSIFFRGKVLSIGVLLSAAVMLMAHRLEIPLIQDKPWFAVGAGAVLYVLSVVLLREQEGF
jgi:serine/threonine protein kinase